MSKEDYVYSLLDLFAADDSSDIYTVLMKLSVKDLKTLVDENARVATKLQIYNEDNTYEQVEVLLTPWEWDFLKNTRDIGMEGISWTEENGTEIVDANVIMVLEMGMEDSTDQ